MIPSFTADPVMNQCMFVMSTLSPKVRDAVETESYRQDADSDAATDQYILEFAFVELIKDLNDIGVTFNTEYGEFVTDLAKLNQFLHLLSYLMPNSLYGMLKTNPRIKDCIQHILDGSLGYNETFLQTYLSELGGLDGKDPIVPDLVEILDEYYSVLVQSEIFTDTIRNQMMLVEQERSVAESTADDHGVYRDHIRNLIGRLSDAVNKFASWEEYDQLCQYQNFIIRDWTSPTNYLQYRYLLLESPATLPDDLHASFAQKQYYYKVSHPWCLEYYSIRMMVPTAVQQILIYCFLYATNVTKAAFDAASQEHRTLQFPDDTKFVITSLYQE